MIDNNLMISKQLLHKIYLERLIKQNMDNIEKSKINNTEKTYMSRLKNYSRYHVNKLLKTSYGFHSSDLNIIFLNVSDIHEKQTLRNINQHKNNTPYDFNELICETYTHECIHAILEDLISFEASHKYDNVYRKLRDNNIMG